jgi:hypothetical protein
MAFSLLGTLPVSFSKKMLSHSVRKFSSLAISNSNFSRTAQCKGSYKDAKDHRSQTIARESTNFQPSIWTDDYIQSLNSEYKA